MAERRITNCHVHTFTARHVPRYYPNVVLFALKPVIGLVAALAWAIRLVNPDGADTLDRLLRFAREADVRDQAEILARMRRHYPASTRFVVLPMDMGLIEHGPVEADIRDQHDELARMASDPELADVVIPFASVHPDREGAAAEVRRMVDRHQFRGLKLYPRLGYPPDHPVLMNQIYPFLVERNLPVMTHCSRGGVRGRWVTESRAQAWCDPRAYIPVMERFPDLRICLAHFGGQQDWRAYVDRGLAPGDDAAMEDNWQVSIRRMICSGAFPGLWTDISYTLFHFEDYAPFLRLFLAGPEEGDERLRRRVLFGSDFYMTRQERLSERAVCVRLRSALGEDLFWRIAEENPGVWLGERDERSGD